MITGDSGYQKLNVVVLLPSDGNAGRRQCNGFPLPGTVQKKKFHYFLSPYKVVVAGAGAVIRKNDVFKS